MPKYKEKHLTVVYTVNDNDAFDDEFDSVMNKFKTSEGEQWAITAVSMGHEMNRIHWIEEALDANDINAARNAISHARPDTINSLEELQ